MINEYKFYRSYDEYIINKSEEIFDINGHKVSKEIFDSLYTKAIKNYKLHTTQYCTWTNHISKAHTYSMLEVFKRKEN